MKIRDGRRNDEISPAQLGNAYQELAKELSSEKLKVIGGYTLGRVIGEGAVLLERTG